MCCVRLVKAVSCYQNQTIIWLCYANCTYYYVWIVDESYDGLFALTICLFLIDETGGGWTLFFYLRWDIWNSKKFGIFLHLLSPFFFFFVFVCCIWFCIGFPGFFTLHFFSVWPLLVRFLLLFWLSCLLSLQIFYARDWLSKLYNRLKFCWIKKRSNFG